jgi:hypothetical protein
MNELAKVEKIVRINELQGDVFEVVSITVMDEEFEMHSLDSFIKVKTMDFFKMIGSVHNHLENCKAAFDLMGLTHRVLSVDTTPLPDENNDNLLLFKLEDDIDFDLAISLGLGIIKMLSGKYVGQYFLYCPFVGENENFDDWDRCDQFLLIRTYIQLKYTNQYDFKLKHILKQNPALISTLIVSKPYLYISRLKHIFGISDSE